MTANQRRWSYFILLVLLILACLPLTAMASPQLNEMLKVTLTVYALARGLNALISVVQGTELAIEPMGVGVTLTPGQILDPLNDLIEQVSFILLVASASIGIQKILLSAGDIELFRGLLILLILITVAVMLIRRSNLSLQKNLLRGVIILSILRLAVPITALTANQMQNWLDNDRQQAIAVLDSTQQSLKDLQQTDLQNDRKWYQGIRDSIDIRGKLQAVENKAEQGVEAVIYLLAEFILVMVLLPLIFLYLGWQLLVKIGRW
ncbi:MAG TPA: hypothetical protein VFM76_04160 [Methylophaga sp.]|nr:hypothetical protein [Methylophaga sp.]